MTTPVYERMRNPITPPKAKPWNRPRIRVKKWREIADKLEAKLIGWSRASEDHLRWSYNHITYIREWIDYAESILNGCDLKEPFTSRHHGPWLRTDSDPHHVHPVIKMEDFV